MFPVRAGTQTTCSGVECTNQEATARPNAFLIYKLYYKSLAMRGKFTHSILELKIYYATFFVLVHLSQLSFSKPTLQFELCPLDVKFAHFYQSDTKVNEHFEKMERVLLRHERDPFRHKTKISLDSMATAYFMLCRALWFLVAIEKSEKRC